MTKLPHYSYLEGCFFITTTARNYFPHFAKSENASIVIETIKGLAFRDRLKLYELVVMPEHVHAIMIPLTLELPHIMAKWKGGSSRLINVRENHVGRRIWMDEYYDEIINNPMQLSGQIEYIWNNPVKRGIVIKPEDYPFSTANVKLANYLGITRD